VAVKDTSNRFRPVGPWLAGLCDRAKRWVHDQGHVHALSEPKTGAYVDLTFAFGLARLGETGACNRLLERATAELAGEDKAHSFLLRAYDCRIRRALEGHPHGGPLPTEQMDDLADLLRQRDQSWGTSGTGPVYVIDRLCAMSRILEPDQKVDPYRIVPVFVRQWARALGQLPETSDRNQVAERVRGLLQKVPGGREGPEVRAYILRTALDQGPRVGEDFAAEMLALTPAAFDALPPPTCAGDFYQRAELLERGLFVATHFDRKEYVQQLVTRFGRLLQTQRDAPTVQAIDALADQSFRSLRKLGMRQETDKLLQLMLEVLLKGRDLGTIEDPEWRARQPAALRALLYAVRGWYFLGRDGPAETVLNAARAALLAPLPRTTDNRPALSGRDVRARAALACAYVSALSQSSVELAQERFEELFDKLQGILDTLTTNTHYSQWQLQVVEAVVLAVVEASSDDSMPVMAYQR
jgi:hypothetical protein